MADSSNHIYYYLYNLQGDVIALADAATGKLAATYTYDAWGKIVKINGQNPEDVASTNIANINPFRYRGYYYDTETSLYYLQSRYYDPEVGRFVNIDGFVSTDTASSLTTNLYVFCDNNPIMNTDYYGFGTFICTEEGGNPHTAKYFTKKDKHSKYEKLGSVSVGGGLGGYFAAEETIVKDDKGGIYSVTTFKVGGGVGLAGEVPSIKDVISIDGLEKYDVDDIYDLEGDSHSMGMTLGLVAIEWDGSIDPVNVDVSFTLGVGLEFHATLNHTIVKKII